MVAGGCYFLVIRNSVNAVLELAVLVAYCNIQYFLRFYTHALIKKTDGAPERNTKKVCGNGPNGITDKDSALL